MKYEFPNSSTPSWHCINTKKSFMAYGIFKYRERLRDAIYRILYFACAVEQNILIRPCGNGCASSSLRPLLSFFPMKLKLAEKRQRRSAALPRSYS